MYLNKEVKQQVVGYILHDIIPSKVKSNPEGLKPKEWFESKFNFVEDIVLKRHLGEAFYQARFIEKIRGALGLQAEFNNVFIKVQIILYASIYEAIIDYYLEENKTNTLVQNLMKKVAYLPADDVFCRNTQLIVYKQGKDNERLYPARKKESKRGLKEVQFTERLDVACQMGFVRESQKNMIDAIYKSRNRVHILQAAKEGFKPDKDQSSSAFHELQTFLSTIRYWLKNTKVTESTGTDNTEVKEV